MKWGTLIAVAAIALLGGSALSACDSVLGLDEFGGSGGSGGAAGSGGSGTVVSSSSGMGGSDGYACAPECEPVQLVAQSGAKYLTLHGQRILWDVVLESKCRLHSAEKDGEDPVVVDMVDCLGGSVGPIHVSGLSLFWLHDMTVRKFVPGGRPEVAIFANNVRHFTYDDVYIYHTNASDGQVLRTNKEDFSGLQIIVDQVNVNEALVDGDTIWLATDDPAEGSAIAKASLAEPLMPKVEPVLSSVDTNGARELTAGDSHLYWIDMNGDIFRINKNALDNQPAQLVQEEMDASRLALHGDYLYWVSKVDDRIFRVPIQGQNVQSISAKLIEEPFELAVDADGIFWTDVNGIQHIAP